MEIKPDPLSRFVNCQGLHHRMVASLLQQVIAHHQKRKAPAARNADLFRLAKKVLAVYVPPVASQAAPKPVRSSRMKSVPYIVH